MPPTKSVSPLDAHLGYWLRFVSNHVSHAFARKLATQEATAAEWVVLRELWEGGARAPSVLANRLGMTRGAITKLADRLAAKGLVVRRAVDGDRRWQSLALTDAGRALVPELAALADSNDAEFFANLSAAERAALEATLKSLVRHHGLKAVPVE
ncbi:MAG: MarR family transcriptional regulator [Alphaproteobacteria bacterium]|nr:MarR family transcriptional regulator [Alphaproteobacteria bacterium]